MNGIKNILLKLSIFFLFAIFYNLYDIAGAAAFTDVVITGIPSGVSGNVAIPFSINNASTNLTIDANVQKIEILSASGDNGLSFTLNGFIGDIYYGMTDCLALDPNNIYPDIYPVNWTNAAGQNVKSKLVNGANTIDGIIYNCSGGPYSAAITLRIYYYTPVCTLSADPSGVLTGETSTLSWTVSGATTATIDNGIGALTPAEIAAGSGSKTTPPIVGSVNYTMSITGPDGNATCGPALVGILVPPTGGLVPCARMIDDPTTGGIDESKPCNACAMFYMIKNIINFVLSLTVTFGVFVLVLCGLLYAFSAGNPRRIDTAKSVAGKTIAGICLIFIAWFGVAIILQAFGYANVGVWHQVNC